MEVIIFTGKTSEKKSNDWITANQNGNVIVFVLQSNSLVENTISIFYTPNQT